MQQNHIAFFLKKLSNSECDVLVFTSCGITKQMERFCSVFGQQGHVGMQVIQFIGHWVGPKFIKMS
jgi:hypothetical protein